jgi:hypothetical protein
MQIFIADAKYLQPGAMLVFISQTNEGSFWHINQFHCTDLTSTMRELIDKCKYFQTNLHKQLPSPGDSKNFLQEDVLANLLVFHHTKGQ